MNAVLNVKHIKTLQYNYIRVTIKKNSKNFATKT